MVLTLKRWKSRSSPGIEAGAKAGKTHSHTHDKAAAGQNRAAALPPEGHATRPRARTTRGGAARQPVRTREPARKTLRAGTISPLGDAGWSSPVARQAHNLKVAGSNPAPATKINPTKTHSQAPQPRTRAPAADPCAHPPQAKPPKPMPDRSPTPGSIHEGRGECAARLDGVRQIILRRQAAGSKLAVSGSAGRRCDAGAVPRR